MESFTLKVATGEPASLLTSPLYIQRGKHTYCFCAKGILQTSLLNMFQCQRNPPQYATCAIAFVYSQTSKGFSKKLSTTRNSTFFCRFLRRSCLPDGCCPLVTISAHFCLCRKSSRKVCSNSATCISSQQSPTLLVSK